MQNIARIGSFLLALVLTCTLAAQSHDSVYISEDEIFNMDLEELLNTSINIQVVSVKGDNIFNSPSVVTVVNREQIELYGYQTIGEVLSTLPGMAVYRTYLKRNIPTSRGILQEHYANKVLVMIDGVPIWNAVTGEGTVDRINIREVERVEVLRGPASVLYGTNAFTGAINIVLRKAEQNEVNAYLGLGLPGALNVGVNASIHHNNAAFYVLANSQQQQGASYTFTDEDSVTGRLHDYLSVQDFTLSAQSGSHSLLFQAYQLNESYLGVTPKFTEGAGNPHKGNGLLANYGFRKDLGDWFSMQSNVHFDLNERNLSRSADDDVRSDISGYKTGVSLKTVYTLHPAVNLEVGVDGIYRESMRYTNYRVLADSIVARNNMNGKSIFDISGFTQLNWRWKRISATAGGRYTYNQLYSGDFSSRLAAIYSLATKSSIKLIYGESYRSPSLFELNFRTPKNTVFGNSLLEPEKSRSLEFAYLLSYKHIWMQVTGYWAGYYNKIQRVKGTVAIDDTVYNLVTQYRNANYFEAKGVEFETRYSMPGKLDMFVTYNYVFGSRGDSIGGHYNFKYVPQHALNAGVCVTIFQSLSLAMLGNFVSETHGAISGIGSQKSLDATLNFKQKAGEVALVHSAGVKNILNEVWQIPEYTARNSINSVPMGNFRYYYYSLRITI